MKIHVLTPFYRTHLAPTLIYYLEPMNIEWYPIMDTSDKQKWMKSVPKDLYENKSWIHLTYVKELDMKDHYGLDGRDLSKETPISISCKKFNDFFDTQTIIDDDYYTFMMDDNMYEPEFFDLIRLQTAKIIVCSVYRGNIKPKNAIHATTTLKPLNITDIVPGRVDFGNFIIKGELVKKHRFSLTLGRADGRYIQNLCCKYPTDVVFLPHLYMFFNYFEPGRYDKEKSPSKCFLKEHWENPKIIEL